MRQVSSAAPLSPNQVAVHTLPQRGERDGLPWAFCFENFQGPFKILQKIIICKVAAVPFCLVCLALLSSLPWCLHGASWWRNWCSGALLCSAALWWRMWCLVLCSRRPHGGGLAGVGALLYGDGTREESQSVTFTNTC